MEEFVDVIKDGAIERVSVREARDEGLFILGRPTITPGTNSAPKNFVPGAPKSEKTKLSIDYSTNNVKSELVEHFNWQISKHRRLKNLTRNQLSKLVGTSEENIKMLENGDLPADNFSLISKIEHYLGVVLRKTSSTGSVGMARPVVSPIREIRPASQIPTLAELQKRRESAKSTRMSSFGSRSSGNKASISGGDIEIIE